MGIKVSELYAAFLRKSTQGDNPFTAAPEVDFRRSFPTPDAFTPLKTPPSSPAPAIASVPQNQTVLNSPAPGPSNQPQTKQAQAIFQEMTTREIQAKHALGKKIKLRDGTALALKMDEKLHPPTASIVSKDPLRKATTEALSGPTKQVVWAETNGVAELGKGVKGTIPLGNFATATAGFNASALLNYHTIQPVVTQTINPLSKVEVKPNIIIPITRDELLAAPAGAEFDIKGTGTVMGKASIDASTKLIPTLDIGASASIGAYIKHQGEAAINVRLLNDPGLVQLTLTSAQETQKRAGIDLKAGYKVPDVGHGFLMHIVENAAETPFRRLAKAYTNASLSAEAKTTDRDSSLGRYTLDIGSPNGLAAYKALLRLSTEKADLLSEIKGSGVTKATYEETSHASDFKASAQVSGRRLLLLRALESEKRGEAHGRGENFLLFRENKYSHTQADPIEGPKTAVWDALSVKDEEGEAFHNFFNMKFTAQDKFTTDEEVQRFFKFAEVLGVRPKDDTINTLPKMGVLERIFSNADDTNVKVDIYFTSEGIDNIDQCSRAEARHAFLTHKAHFFPETEGLADLDRPTFKNAVKISQSFEDIQAEKYLEDSGFDIESASMVRKYENETGRDLNIDYRAVLGARNFAVQVETLDGEKGVQNIRSFFSGLGKSQGGLYMTTLAALASLAKRKETLVNQLSMEGQHIHLEAVSEGKMEHPTETVKQIIDENRFKIRPSVVSSKEEGSKV